VDEGVSRPRCERQIQPYKLAGIDPEATFHTLRAVSATNQDAAEQDFDGLQDGLAHAKGNTITRKHYIRPDDATGNGCVLPSYNEYLERLRSESTLDAENSGSYDT